MPWLEQVHQRFKGDNLSIVGLTRVNRSATDEKVRRFIRENDITYPILKENGSARRYFNMPGTPFMTLVRDGKIVWEHRLSTAQFPMRILEPLLTSAGASPQ